MRIKEAREAKGLQQKQVSADLGIARSTFSQYETGKREPDYATLVKIAEYLDVSVDYLLEVDTENKNPPVVADVSAFNPAYLELTPENKALVDALIEKLVSTQSDS